jgi:hypothetical protein
MFQTATECFPYLLPIGCILPTFGIKASLTNSEEIFSRFTNQSLVQSKFALNCGWSEHVMFAQKNLLFFKTVIQVCKKNTFHLLHLFFQVSCLISNNI